MPLAIQAEQTQSRFSPVILLTAESPFPHQLLVENTTRTLLSEMQLKYDCNSKSLIVEISGYIADSGSILADRTQ